MKQSIQIVVRVTPTHSVALQGYGPGVCGQPTLDDLIRFINALRMENRPPETFLGFDRFTAERGDPEKGMPPKLKLGRSTTDIKGMQLRRHAEIEAMSGNFVYSDKQWFFGKDSIIHLYELATLLTLTANPNVGKAPDAATGDRS